MGDECEVVPEELTAHAKQIAGFTDRLAAIAEAARSATESEDLTYAFGVLGNPIGWLLKSQIQEPAVKQIGQIGECSEIVGQRVQVCAQTFAAVDAASAAKMEGQTGELDKEW
ncbi:Excreted virulence factor EspC, type VII ESX diderm [Nocardia amikacinitolerans]|uniref:hypothetical protein n=1 Tax=Nocardia amikacinitolerans TaxID=756689 RepID=UPI00082CAD58|nr:hypothetical protein [Nocardia amikacinitolerans]MCP2319563.1 Excreted virulence factor EspC, type VII ESX diderm [Nocardia amikacinitolerans]